MQSWAPDPRFLLSVFESLAVLLWLRSHKPTSPTHVRDVLLAAPALSTGVVLCALAPDAADWPGLWRVTFLAGLALASAALVTLGRSFALLPRGRPLVASGPYRLVRHPAYLGELVVAMSMCGA